MPSQANPNAEVIITALTAWKNEKDEALFEDSKGHGWMASEIIEEVRSGTDLGKALIAVQGPVLDLVVEGILTKFNTGKTTPAFTELSKQMGLNLV